MLRKCAEYDYLTACIYKEGAMPFNQNFYGSVGTITTIETVNGGLTINGSRVLTEQSDGKDLSRQLDDLRGAIAGLPGVHEAAKDRALANIDAAKKEALSPKPSGGEIKKQLDGAGAALQSATTTAQN